MTVKNFLKKNGLPPKRYAKVRNRNFIVSADNLEEHIYLELPAQNVVGTVGIVAF